MLWKIKIKYFFVKPQLLKYLYSTWTDLSNKILQDQEESLRHLVCLCTFLKLNNIPNYSYTCLSNKWVWLNHTFHKKHPGKIWKYQEVENAPFLYLSKPMLTPTTVKTCALFLSWINLVLTSSHYFLLWFSLIDEVFNTQYFLSMKINNCKLLKIMV